jgi:head-tail adaptor
MFTKRVEIWGDAPVSDGFGGFIQESTFLASSWAKIKTVSNTARNTQRISDLGIIDPSSAIIVTLRYRNDITYNGVNQFIKYKDVKYVIKTSAISVDLKDTYIEIIAAREALTNITNSPVVAIPTFDNTFDNTFL